MNEFLNEINKLANDRLPKQTTVHQEFRIGVSVRTSSKDPKVVRKFLEDFEKQFQDYIYADTTGSIQVEFVGPENR